MHLAEEWGQPEAAHLAEQYCLKQKHLEKVSNQAWGRLLQELYSANPGNTEHGC